MENIQTKAYETPKAEIILFGTEDVITTSRVGDENEGPFVPAAVIDEL